MNIIKLGLIYCFSKKKLSKILFFSGSIYRRTGLALIIILCGLIHFQAYAAPSSLTYQGRILKSNGAPLEYGHVSFIFQIVNPGGQCVIYQEQVDGVDMSNSGGVFDVAIGNGTVQFPLGESITILDVFNNSSTFTCGSCSSSNGTYSCTNGDGSYTAASGDVRKLRVSFYDGISWKLITPDNTVRSVPFAGYALSAEKLGTNVASDFVTKAGLPNCGSGTFLTWNGTSLSCAAAGGGGGSSLVSGTATGQVYRWDESAWAAAKLKYTDLVNATAANPWPTTTCASGEAVTWSSATDSFSCTSLSIAATQITAGTIAAARMPAFTGGDVTSNAGSVNLTLANSGVTAGTYSKVSVDIKGRVTTGANIGSSDVTTALGFNPLNKAGDVMTGLLGLNGVTSDPAGLNSGDKGKMWFRTDTNEVKYWNGSAAVTLGASGAGLTSLGGQTGNAQTFAVGTSGTAPSWNSASDTHTFNIPMANMASVTAGLISKTDYDTFNTKLGTTLPSAQIFVGNGSNVATGVAMSGDATISNAGALTIANNAVTDAKVADVSVSKITNGATKYFAYKPNNTACADGQVLSWDNTNSRWICANVDSVAGTINLASQVTGVLPTANGGTSASTAAGARSNLGLGTVATLDSGSAAGNVPVLGTGGLVANQMCTSDGTAAGIICTSTIPTSSQWATSGSDISFSTGKVGIGTVNPLFKLDNQGDFRTYLPNGNQFTITPGATSNDGVVLESKWESEDTFNGWGPIIFKNGNAEFARFDINAGLVVNNGGSFNGAVGIGTTWPSAQLEVSGTVKITGGSPGAGKVLTSDADGLASWQAASVTPAGANTEIQYNNSGTLGGSSGFTWDNSNNKLWIGGAGSGYTAGPPGGGITVYYNAGLAQTIGLIVGVDGAGTNSSTTSSIITGGGSSQNLAFGTRNTGETMRITTTGNVGIGLTDPTYQLQLSTDSAAKPGTSTWTIASDERLKDIRAPFERGLASIEGIHPIYFTYRKDNPLDLPSAKEYVGIKAQDVLKVVPEAVSQDDKGYYHVTNDAIIWTVLNAVKELYHKWLDDSTLKDRQIASKADRTEVEALESDNSARDQKITKLEKENTQIKQENAEIKARLEQIEKMLHSK